MYYVAIDIYTYIYIFENNELTKKIMYKVRTKHNALQLLE